MERTEYTEKMKSLCRQQAELKIAHMDALEEHEAKTAEMEDEVKKQLTEIRRKARQESRKMKATQNKEQLELEFAKQTLRTDYLMEHPEENNRV